VRKLSVFPPHFFQTKPESVRPQANASLSDVGERIRSNEDSDSKLEIAMTPERLSVVVLATLSRERN
jgi:hypothetical protein